MQIRSWRSLGVLLVVAGILGGVMVGCSSSETQVSMKPLSQTAVITDDSGISTDGSAAWPTVLAAQSETTDAYVDADAGSGYLIVGDSGKNAEQRVREAVASSGVSTLIIALGMRDVDAGYVDEEQAVSAITAALAPAASVGVRVVVLAPISVTGEWNSLARQWASWLMEAAQSVGVEYLNPVESGWIVADGQVADSTGLHFTREGSMTFAEELSEHLGLGESEQ